MTMELQVLHTTEGDRKKKFDTKTEAGRSETKKAIDGMLRKGTAIFVETGKDTYRVVGYDPKRDVIQVRVDAVGPVGQGRANTKTVGRKSDKATKMTAVAPRAEVPDSPISMKSAIIERAISEA